MPLKTNALTLFMFFLFLYVFLRFYVFLIFFPNECFLHLWLTLILNVLVLQDDETALDLTDGDPDVSNDAVAPLPLSFEVLDAGTSKGKTWLIDSHGYNYCIKMRRDRRVYWRCNWLHEQYMTLCIYRLRSSLMQFSFAFSTCYFFVYQVLCLSCWTNEKYYIRWTYTLQ